MPAKITKLKGGKVRVSTPNGVKAKSTTLAKGKAQARLLNAIDHGFTPGQKKVKKMLYVLLLTLSLSVALVGCSPTGHQSSAPERFVVERYEVRYREAISDSIFVITDTKTGWQYLKDGHGLVRLENTSARY